ncbi:MAG: ribosome-associated translation inhibitor RaiA [Bacteroidota bacterium]|nr:ribosome-associated translation inhibitor RaiA [Bacteroidota bacterium]
MNINVRSLRFDADKKLVEFINEKMEKLTKVAPDVIAADVTLRVDNGSSLDNKFVEIKIEIPKNDEIFAKKQAKSFEEAVDLNYQALRRQLKKFKEKQRQK